MLLIECYIKVKNVANKKKSKNSIARPQSASPPETLRDEFTGRYIGNKKEAIKQWFKDAKLKTNSITDFNKTIDPKQAIYGSDTKIIKKVLK